MMGGTVFAEKNCVDESPLDMSSIGGYINGLQPVNTAEHRVRKW